MDPMNGDRSADSTNTEKTKGVVANGTADVGNGAAGCRAAGDGLPRALVRKLETLRYPDLDSASLSGHAYCKLILWLEEEKIRLYNKADRKVLRTFDESWFKYATAYAKELNVHADGLSESDLAVKLRVLNAVVNLALQDVYRDKLEANELGLAAAPKPVAGGNNKHQLGNLAPSINRLLAHFRLPKLPQDVADTDVIAALRAIKLRACPKAQSGPSVQLDLNELPAGLEIDDQEVRHAAAVLRLLHGIEMQQLQVNINHVMNDLQQLTADPKTDSRLGKVGT
mmetsp:Transcript_65252/g.183700  ORF Transcript_65252/g.183700 Transcript_65252/m.183700 type:complete len:283 (-) Transcript_65252:93-941(-)